MITLAYHPDPDRGRAFADGECDAEIDRWIARHNSGQDHRCWASTENIFLALRVAIKQGKISHEDVLVEFNGQLGEFDKDGRSEFWPDGFCDYTQKKLFVLLDWNN